jgi:FtsP/CotA-like multicopper oxidase with cupredoxin domain
MACRVQLAAAPDRDPDPDVVEVQLRAAPFAWDPGTGQAVTDGLAFEGQVPGPTIVVQRGQRLRVHFLDDTEMENTLHWHGMRVPEAQDGVSQMDDPVQPGEEHVYEFEVPDAGLCWYHPHMDTDHALERGLYGTIWVQDPTEPEVDCLSVVVLG